MTINEERRLKVMAAIEKHVASFGNGDWKKVREEFPGMPPATFWRYVRAFKQANDGGEPSLADARRRLANHIQGNINAPPATQLTDGFHHLNLLGRVAQLLDDIGAMRNHSLSADGKIENPQYFAAAVSLQDRSINTAVKCAGEIMNISAQAEFFDAMIEEICAVDPDVARRIIERIRVFNSAWPSP